MIFRFLLNGTEIEEPIGFDNFKPVIERTDHHGMAASISLSKIGFYGDAMSIIQSACDTDIDTELSFIVQIKNLKTIIKWTEKFQDKKLSGNET